MIRAVIFDFDGTLFQFLLDYKGMRNAVKEVVITAGVPASTLKDDDRIRDFVNKMFSYAKASGWSNAKAEQIMNQIKSVMDRYEWESAQNNTPMNGAMEVLSSLKRRGLRTGLLTNNSRRCIVYLLKKYGFSKMLDAIVTRDDLVDFNQLKPSPVGLSRVLKMLKVKADETIYIGDSIIDVRTALEVGVTPIFITTGYSTEKEVRENYPNVVVFKQLTQLLAHVQSMRRKEGSV